MTSTDAIAKHKGLILHWAKRYNRSLPHAYEDVLQEATIAFATAWDKSDADSPEPRRVAYASTCMRNHLNSMVAASRAQMRAAVCLSLDAPSRTGSTLEDIIPYAAPEYTEDLSDIVQAALAKLSKRDRDLLTEVYINQVPASKIADRLDLTRMAICLRLKTAAARLRRALPATTLRDLRTAYAETPRT